MPGPVVWGFFPASEPGGLTRGLGRWARGPLPETGAVDRAAAFAPVGEELGHPARVHHRAREGVVADLGGLLEDEDRLVGEAACLQEPLEMDRAGEVRRPRTDEEDVDRQLVALDVLRV